MRDNARLIMADLGSKIRRVRMAQNMSQVELAQRCDLSVPYISDIERGKKCISVDIFLRIAKTLQVSTDWLLDLDIPTAKYEYNSEATELLSDCTPEEMAILLRFMYDTKKTMRSVMKKYMR